MLTYIKKFNECTKIKEGEKKMSENEEILKELKEIKELIYKELLEKSSQPPQPAYPYPCSYPYYPNGTVWYYTSS